jgi:hypothetical protein
LKPSKRKSIKNRKEVAVFGRNEKWEIFVKEKQLNPYEEVNLGTEDILRQLLKLNDELLKLKDDDLYEMKDDMSERKDDLSALIWSHTTGKYLSHLADYWEELDVNVPRKNSVYDC